MEAMSSIYAVTFSVVFRTPIQVLCIRQFQSVYHVNSTNAVIFNTQNHQFLKPDMSLK